MMAPPAVEAQVSSDTSRASGTRAADGPPTDPPRVVAAVEGLSRWIESNGPAGPDPYDAQSSPFAGAAGLLGRWGRIAFQQGVLRSPVDLRRWLRIPPRVNAKAMGLIARARIDLRVTRGEARQGELAVESLDWLESHAWRRDGRCGWGYPFDWAARSFFVPRGTPSVVVTAVVAEAFLAAAAALGRRRYLELARSAAAFVLTDLARHESDDGLCFSYTALDDSRILNASLLGAELLTRVATAEPGDENARARLLEPARRALRFVLRQQRADGAWPYGLAAHHGWVDGHHTGFVLRSLSALRQATGWEEIAEPLDRGLRFYDARLIAADGRPLHRLDTPWPADIHACAEAILVFSDPGLLSARPELLSRAHQVAGWTLARLGRADGSFGFRRHASRTDLTPYLRWGQAWMLRALAQLERSGGAAPSGPPSPTATVD